MSPYRFATTRVLASSLVLAYVFTSPVFPPLRVAAGLLAILLAAGLRRRLVGVILLFLWGWMLRNDPNGGPTVLLLPAGLLAVFALTPEGATARVPDRTWEATWLWFSLTAAVAGFQAMVPKGTMPAPDALPSPLGLLLVLLSVLAPFRKTRPLGFLLGVLLVPAIAIRFRPLAGASAAAMLLFLFDSRWIRVRAQAPLIVFFDGFCGLCDRFVDFLLEEDQHEQLRFAPIQGTTAATDLLGVPEAADVTSVIVKSEQGLQFRSAAALTAISRLGGLWSFVRIFLAVPTPLRDGIYDWVARNRYKWFPKRETCRLPTRDERTRFLP